MLKRLTDSWHRLSRIGLYDHETLMQFREVVLINRLLIFIPFIMLIYIPVEIFVNGFKMIPAVLMMVVLFMITLVFHYFRWFKFSKYYLYLISSFFIVFMGVAVGKGINNHVMLLPILLVGVMIFKSTTDRVVIFILTVGFFLMQHVLFKNIIPVAGINDQVKEVFSLVFFIMCLTITFIVGFYFMGINKEYETIIISQKEGLELKNKEITDSITYAKRIQTAILPSENKIRSFFEKNFILYLPKDVVAGDFYWFEKHEDVIMFAAADCTGHGVPGAMMSVICNNALNRCVREEKITHPSHILNRVREIIIDELSKSTSSINDGMDISLCAFNSRTLELKWAGANNPLYLISNSNLKELKADKQPIGNYIGAKPFSQHSLQLNKGDVIYLCTDGFQDQFGGEKGKKYKTSNLKSCFLKLSVHSIERQKELLLHEFLNWKKDAEQVDDVCVIAIQV